jgi:hypothetical protein
MTYGFVSDSAHPAHDYCVLKQSARAGEPDKNHASGIFCRYPPEPAYQQDFILYWCGSLSAKGNFRFPARLNLLPRRSADSNIDLNLRRLDNEGN